MSWGGKTTLRPSAAPRGYSHRVNKSAYGRGCERVCVCVRVSRQVVSAESARPPTSPTTSIARLPLLQGYRGL